MTDQAQQERRPLTPFEAEQAKVRATFMVTVLKNKWIPHRPTEKQGWFLAMDHVREVFYGGAAGGGKSDALLMAALQYFDVPGYSALLLRRSFSDLALPGALMDRSQMWLSSTPAHWNSDSKTWTNPESKATITFGYLESDKDLYRYQSAEFQLIGFDELTQFPENFYTFMFSRMRRNVKAQVPLRMRGASNPGNLGHEWVKRRFITAQPTKDRRFVPAKLDDNPHLDQEGYRQSLLELDSITRAQLLGGNWDIKRLGSKFDKQWWKYTTISKVPKKIKRVRYWDLAATEAKPGKDPDYTVGTRMSMIDGRFYIEDVVRFRCTPAETEQIIKDTTDRDYSYDPAMVWWMEQEPGAAGIITVDHYARYVLVGYDFRAHRVTGEKELRANPLSAAAENGNVYLIEGEWNQAYEDEMQLYPLGEHDDQADSSSGAYERLTTILEGEGVLDYYEEASREYRLKNGIEVVKFR